MVTRNHTYISCHWCQCPVSSDGHFSLDNGLVFCGGECADRWLDLEASYLKRPRPRNAEMGEPVNLDDETSVRLVPRDNGAVRLEVGGQYLVLSREQLAELVTQLRQRARRQRR